MKEQVLQDKGILPLDVAKVLILEKIKEYLAELRKHNINIERVFLFGSYVRGNYHPDSDIDIAIISKDFQGIRFYDRDKLVPLRRKIDVRIEPIPFRPEDFSDDDPLAAEVIATGEEIKLN